MVTSILDVAGLHTTNRAVGASLKQAWREAESMVAQKIKRTSEGLQETEPDAPLSGPAQDAITDAFKLKYDMDLFTWQIPCDALIGRIKREFDRSAPTFFPLGKVKSVRHTTREHETKKQKLSEDISISFHEEVYVGHTNKLRVAMLQLEVLINGWGIAGCYSLPGETKMVCHWNAAVRYHRALKDKCEALLDIHPEAKVVAYFLACEESFRGHALEMARRRESPISWGEAIAASLKEFGPTVWGEMNAILGSNRDPASGVTGSALAADAILAQPKAARKDQLQQMMERGKISTGTHTAKGLKVCKAYNDQRNCPTPCKRGEVHACDALLANSKLCEKKHPRHQHEPAKHGKTQLRPNN